MKHYYYSKNNTQLGPFTLEELRTKLLTKSTLVWTEGFTEWVRADSVEELKDIVISEPPPLPPLVPPPPPDKSSKYDMTYEKDTAATIFGIALIALTILLNIMLPSDSGLTNAYFSIGSLAIRIFVTLWVVKIAHEQNRNGAGWGVYAFLLPSIALIHIGQLRRLKVSELAQYEEFSPIEQAEWVSNPDKCSACGHSGVLNETICPECGINLV